MTRHLALLRSVNVGGRNKVPMADLRAAFADLGATDVQTYIASGNVLFAGDVGAAELEAGLSARFGFEIKIVVVSADELAAVVADAPPGFGAETDRCDVIFLRPPLTADVAFGLLDPREGVDRAWQGTNVLYFARLAARASGSRLSKIVSLPEYQEMTIRSWATVSRLADLAESGG